MASMLGLHSECNRIDCLRLRSLTGVTTSYMRAYTRPQSECTALLSRLGYLGCSYI
jgi:hypothetical protein